MNNVADFLSGIPEYDAVVESIESESDNILNNEKEGSTGGGTAQANEEGGAVRAEEDGDKREMEKAKDNPEQMSKLKEMSNYLDLKKEK